MLGAARLAITDFVVGLMTFVPTGSFAKCAMLTGTPLAGIRTTLPRGRALPTYMGELTPEHPGPLRGSETTA